MSDEEETDYVQEILKFSEVFVYKVPPLTSVHSGHRAETWKLESPFATCSMKVLAKGDTILLQLFSIEKQGQLVAACPIDLEKDETNPGSKLEYWVEAVKDSARYFVIRMVDVKSRKQALLGIGFRERPAAFEFQEALNHHFNRVLRLRGVTQKKHEDDDEEVEKQATQVANQFSDLSLKQPIKLVIPGTKAGNRQAPAAQVNQSKQEMDDDVDWGDFQ